MKRLKIEGFVIVNCDTAILSSKGEKSFVRMLSQPNDKSQSPPTIPVSSNVSSISFSQIVTIILTFVSGLFIGLALKKGILAFLFAIIGLLILGYVGIAFM